MNAAFLTKPVPHSEAVEMIRSKPAVAREIYDRLPAELKGRALTISGIEDFDLQQAVQDKLATLPAGADWKKLRKEIAADLSPWLGEEEGLRRAKLLLNHHGAAAYAATAARIVHDQEDVFPYLMYRSSRTSKEPRSSHAALDGLILPSNHPFWATHTPPWEFGCNCLQPIPLTEEDAEEERQADARRGEEARRVATPEQLAALEQGTLVRGPNATHNIQTPREKSGEGFEFDWEATTLPYEQIRTRWTEDVVQLFESWAEKQEMEGGTNLLQHLTGMAPGGGRMKTFRAASIDKALDTLGLRDKETWERADLAALRTAMKKPDPRPAEMYIDSIEGTRKTGVLTAAEIRRGVQDVLDMLPAEVADKLPALKIRIVERLTEDGKPTITVGRYTSGGRLQLSVAALKGLRGNARRQEMRRLLSHELMHWVHGEAQGPRAEAYRAAIRSHYAARTTGKEVETAPEGYLFKDGGWWDKYAGKLTKEEQENPSGRELPSTHFELWETPARLTLESDLSRPTGAGFRETFELVNSVFDTPAKSETP